MSRAECRQSNRYTVGSAKPTASGPENNTSDEWITRVRFQLFKLLSIPIGGCLALFYPRVMP